MTQAMQQLLSKWNETKPLVEKVIVQAKGDPEDASAVQTIMAEMDSLQHNLRQVVPQ